MATQRLARAESGHEVDCVALLERRERASAKRLWDGVEREAAVLDLGDGQADAADGDRVTDRGFRRRRRRVDDETDSVGAAVDGSDAPLLTHDPGEHGRIITVSARLVTDTSQVGL